jgi:hypothetical protein
MINTAARLCDRLGLTPASRAQLGLDLSRIEPSMVARLQQKAEPR